MNLTKGLIDENSQPPVQQELERGGVRGSEGRELHRVCAGESSTSTATDTSTGFATPSITNWKIAKKLGSKMLGESP